MADGPMTFADIIVAGVMLVSGLFAFVRGFSREVMTIAAWGVAFGITIYAYPPLQEFMKEKVSDSLLANAILAIGLFVVPLFGLSFITHWAGQKIQNSRVGPVDRTLGFFFGLVRGLAAVVILFWMYTLAVPDDDEHPKWVAKAKLQPLMVEAIERINDWFRDVARAHTYESDRLAEILARTGGDELSEELRDRIDLAAEKSYSKRDRRTIERIVSTASGDDR